MRKLLRYLLLNYLVLTLCTLPFALSLVADPEPYLVFRNLQRMIEPSDRVFIGVTDYADGHCVLDCRIFPGAYRQALEDKLQAAQSLLLLNEKDQILEQHVPSPPAPHPAETFLFNLLTGLIVGLFFWANPAGRLSRWWTNRHSLGSQLKLALAFTLVVGPALPHLGPWLSRLYWESRIASVVGQPHQTFRTLRNGHQGIVVVVYSPAPQLQAKLAAALNLSAADRLAVFQVPKPVSTDADTPSPWMALVCLLATLYYWKKTTPQERLQTWLRFKALLGLNERQAGPTRHLHDNPEAGPLDGLSPLP